MRTRILKSKYNKLWKLAQEKDMIVETTTKVVGLRFETAMVLDNGVKLVATVTRSSRWNYYIAFTNETIKAAFEFMAEAGVGLEGGYGIGTMV